MSTDDIRRERDRAEKEVERLRRLRDPDEVAHGLLLKGALARLDYWNHRLHLAEEAQDE